MIKRLKNKLINKKKWDEVISASDNPHVYYLSWYLDIVSPKWNCYVYNNYQFVFPLPLKQKWGIPYLVQPLFCQKIEIAGRGVKPDIASIFYRRLFRQYLYLNLQIANITGLHYKGAVKRINYTLGLISPYSVLMKGYHENTVRNLKKAERNNLTVRGCDICEYLTFSKQWMQGIGVKEFPVFEQLIKESLKQNVAKLFKVTAEDGEVMAAACFLVWNRQIVYLAGASSANGKSLSAMFLIFDKIIKEYSETGWLLDFEGSMIPGVAKFFQGFGAKETYYYHLKKYLFF